MIVRSLDLAEHIMRGRLGVVYPGDRLEDGLGQVYLNAPGVTLERCLLYLHRLTSQVLEGYRKTKNWDECVEVMLARLARVIVYAAQLIQALTPHTTPTEVVLGIIEANKARGYRHGGRRS